MKSIETTGKDITIVFRKTVKKQGFALVVTNDYFMWRNDWTSLEESKWTEYEFFKKLSKSRVIKLSRKLIKLGCIDANLLLEFKKYTNCY